MVMLAEEQVHGDEAVPARELRAQLPVPGKPALREAVEKKDRWSARVSRFHEVEPSASSSGDGVVLHGFPPHWVAALIAGITATNAAVAWAGIEMMNDAPYVGIGRIVL